MSICRERFGIDARILPILVLSILPQVSSGESPHLEPRELGPIFAAYCCRCHGEGEILSGDVDLREAGEEAWLGDIDRLQQVIDVLALNEMPPEDESQVPDDQKARLLRTLRFHLRTRVADQATIQPTPIRRMNRFQYNNAVTDLFELKCNVFTLPERMLREHNDYFRPDTGKMGDVVFVGSRPLGKSQMIEPRLAGVAAFPQDLRAEHGFDNQADHLSLSPLLMEAFLKLGASVTGSPDFSPKQVGVWHTWFADPGEEVNREAALEERVTALLKRAFRRPIDKATLQRYVQYGTSQLQRGVSFPEAMKRISAAVIASPRFLYLYDIESGSVEHESDFNLASRLSFFLWGSIPDAELLAIAATGDLGDRTVLADQFHRMLRDQKVKRFCDSFPAQWLQLERIISAVPSRELFPNFYFSKYRDSMHMMAEPLLLFETVLIENHPITQLIDSDFTYRSQLLEEAYAELGNVESEKPSGDSVAKLRFYRVPVDDRRNGGVITTAAVMTMTSGPERTKPITRGAWLAGVIFNQPPDPPPADVPPLDEKPPEGEEHLTLRERLAMHRKRADCRSCHEQIDPLGFALENYNPIGAWRDQYDNGREVDISGILFRRRPFRTIEEFKDAILEEKDEFTRGLAGHLLGFALAREIQASDQPALDQIVEATAADGYRMQTLLKQVVLSPAFRMTNKPQFEGNR